MEKKDVEALLAAGSTVQVSPRGYSMYPLFVPGRDQAVIAPSREVPPKRGDIVLYRRKEGILVLHRIWKREKDHFYAVGDHQWEVEGPLEVSCILGAVTGIVRKGRFFSVKNLLYRVLAGLWLWARPVRRYCLRMAGWMRNRIKGSCESQEARGK